MIEAPDRQQRSELFMSAVQIQRQQQKWKERSMNGPVTAEAF